MSITSAPFSSTSRVLQVIAGLSSTTKIQRIRAARVCSRCGQGEAFAVAPLLAQVLSEERDPDVLVVQMQAVIRLCSHTPHTVDVLRECVDVVLSHLRHSLFTVRYVATRCLRSIKQAQANVKKMLPPPNPPADGGSSDPGSIPPRETLPCKVDMSRGQPVRSNHSGVGGLLVFVFGKKLFAHFSPNAFLSLMISAWLVVVIRVQFHAEPTVDSSASAPSPHRRTRRAGTSRARVRRISVGIDFGVRATLRARR